MHRYWCDVLVVGGGGAAIRAAIAAKEANPRAKVVLITKGEFGKSGVTATACSDRMAFHATLAYTEPGTQDNWRYHAEDIYRIGGCVSDWNLAVILAQNSGAAFEYLDGLGVPFVKRPDGRADQFVTDGSRYARACYTGPKTANHIEEALVKKIKTMDVEIFDHLMLTELITSEDGRRVIGAFGLNTEAAESLEDRGLCLFQAKAAVMATGGAGGAFRVNVYPPGMTGDGYAAAYRAGAELVNMEFIQIGLSSVKTKLACSGSMMRAIPRFVNESGEEFLAKYFPPDTSYEELYNTVFEKGASWPVSNEHRSNLIDIAVFKEINSGHNVYLDYSENPSGFDFDSLSQTNRGRYQAEIKARVSSGERNRSPFDRLREINPDSIEWLKEHDLDLARGEKVELAPAIQHFQGGIKISPEARTSLGGLYAAGECAGGQHGANRPGGNALMDSQVFGKIAGSQAAREAETIRLPEVPRVLIQQQRHKLEQLLDMTRGLAAGEARMEVQEILSRVASVVRTDQGLTEGLAQLELLRSKGLHADQNGLAFALETLSIFDVAEMVMRSARMRRESRGPHLFFSCPDDEQPLTRDDQRWAKYIVISKGPEGMRLEVREPVRPKEKLLSALNA
ncbi:MAG: succinate dehydrogenase [Candidatus Latescibacterota bacterium]|nr:MAG: succinate dehydrogenase [Candidatus Latescibacterota bacterium]